MPAPIAMVGAAPVSTTELIAGVLTVTLTSSKNVPKLARIVAVPGMWDSSSPVTLTLTTFGASLVQVTKAPSMSSPDAS